MSIKSLWAIFSVSISFSLILAGSPGLAETPQTHTNGIGMEFVLIPAGAFQMGANPNFGEAGSDEMPQHQVTISQPYYLGKYEVTQEQWVAVMGSNPSEFKGRSNPVEQVSWDDIQIFIRKLNQKEGTDKYRLPTEAEWEYAARAGTTTAFSFGDDAGEMGSYGWYKDNSGKKTHPVGQKQPNALGLYDMHGNVWEWVQDWYGDKYYSRESASDPSGPSSGSSRVGRGGSWYSSARSCRSANRDGNAPDDRAGSDGFRLALSPSQ